MRVYRARRGAPRGAAQPLITEYGVVARAPAGRDAGARRTADGVFPDGFYSTTNLDRRSCASRGEWVRVQHPEMDCGIRVDPQALSAETVAMSDVAARRARTSTGHRGIRVRAPGAARARASPSSSWPRP